MSRRFRSATRTARKCWLLLTLAILQPGGPLLALSSVEETGLELTTPVRHQLRLLQDAWQSWTRAFYQADQEAAAAAVDQLQAITQHLGMSRLPDLSVAAAAFAVKAAQDSDFERARWALGDSRRLDPERPETAFAAAAVHRFEGDWIGVGVSSLQGYLRLFRLPLERTVWLHNVGLWLILSMVISGGLFVAFQLARRGRTLYLDILRLMPSAIAPLLAELLVVLLLVWPLLLPGGLFWLALYWSVLLWGYGSISEKAVFVLLWLVLGATPLVLSVQQRSVQLALIPPARVIDNLATGRLYGALFSDLGVLRSLIPDSPAMLEIVADIHRRFGQWDHARLLYNELALERQQDTHYTAAPLSNLGLFHLRNQDYGTAVSYFQRAADADPSLAEAYFNLSQGYSQMFEFSLSNDALERANELDRDGVGSWKDPEASVAQSGIGVDGGIRRASDIRAELQSTWRAGDSSASLIDLWRRHLSLSIAAAAILLAVTLYLVRRQLGAPSSVDHAPAEAGPVNNRWARALVPGLASAGLGRGGRAFAGILLPVGLAVLPLVRKFGYRAPVGYDPGDGLPVTVSVVTLVILVSIRLGWELTRTPDGGRRKSKS